MIYTLMGYLHAVVARRLRRIRSLAEGEAGQGTVEYVGLILLVSLLMVGMVAAMKGFNRSLSKGGYYQDDRTAGAKIRRWKLPKDRLPNVRTFVRIPIETRVDRDGGSKCNRVDRGDLEPRNGLRQGLPGLRALLRRGIC